MIYKDSVKTVIQRGVLKKDIKTDDKLIEKGANVNIVSYTSRRPVTNHKLFGGSTEESVPFLDGTFLEYYVDGHFAIHISTNLLPENISEYI